MKIEVRNTKSPIGFATEGGDGWAVWDRFLKVNGEKVHHIGNICDTCNFFFERVQGPVKSLEIISLREELDRGITKLTNAHAETLCEILPDGEYDLNLLSVSPQIVKPGGKADYFAEEGHSLWCMDGCDAPVHDPCTNYYRGMDRDLGKGARLFEFVVPMYPEAALDGNRVEQSKEAINLGNKPTALAVSVLDVKQPAHWEGDPEVTCHWCLAHYLLDGHHKMYAAASTGKEVGIVSMLALQQGVSSDKDHKRLQRVLRRR